MPSLTIKGLPDDLYERLKARAEENRRSLNREVITCLEQAVATAPRDVEALLARADALRERVRAPLLTEARLRAARSSGRP
ncbi:MAG TPA: Arc family DNA-binding protein [Gemmatimonadaceae bacterium]|nr:Arc family DNA-binding protein [Gemmatimonadaceae bacterium]